jgi:radical SAM superfamily enzyme YgiQ (UPF0313 family)
MGRQPFGLASPAAWLRRDGWAVHCVDVAKQKLTDEAIRSADLVGFHLPMHTATRLAGPVIARVRGLNPSARVCAFGLYAPLNERWLQSLGVDAIFGGEFEEDLAQWAAGPQDPPYTRRPRPSGPGVPHLTPSTPRPPNETLSAGSAISAWVRRDLPRIHFLVPDRSTLPPLAKYATLQMPDGSRRAVGYTEASRGCKHLCRHCPVVPIYNGQFRIVSPEVVLSDIDAQVAAGAQHITFGDPDFLNGPTHAMRLVDALHAAHPDVSYDVTIKIEHLRRHRELLPHLARTGCAFVTSAVESVDDRVLALLDKGHTRADFVEAVAWCREASLTIVPTFVAFHPWLTLRSYCELLETIAGLDLVDHVAPIQLAIRLLVPEGSRLLACDEMRPHLGPFDPATLTYRWTHPDPAVDALHLTVARVVGTRVTADRRTAFEEIRALAHEHAGLLMPSPRPVRDRATVPYLNEPWYC